MIVECPRCNARYRVDEEVIAEQPTFKCSRCDHLFSAEGPSPSPHRAEPQSDLDEPDPEPDPRDAEPELAAGRDEDEESPGGPEETPAPAPRTTRRAPGSAPENLDLPFATSPVVEDDEEDEEPEDHETDDEDVEDSRRGRESGSFRFRDDDFRDDEGADVVDADDDGSSGDQPRFLRSFASEENDTAPTDRMRRPFLIFLGVLLLFYGNLALYFRNHAEAAERALANVPLFGRLLVENRLLQSRVYLRDLEGVFQRIKDGRTVFIVSGRAVNTAETAVKGVEVESALYDGGGELLATKSIFCGNAMSLKIVKDLSSKEISILQRLQPPQRFEIAPGDAAGFSVVFLEPPEGFAEFSARVATAQPALS